MTELELAAAVRAVREQAPPGMGDFTIRSLAKAALEAAEKVRPETTVADAMAWKRPYSFCDN